MTNTKITDLNEMTVPLNTDIIPIVDDPGGSPVNEKITVGNLLAVGSNMDVISRETIALNGNEFTEVNIPSGVYHELEIHISGAAMSANRTNVLLNFGNASIDTGANYWYRVLDDYNTNQVNPKSFISLTRTAWAYNNSARHSSLTVYVNSLSSGIQHIIITSSNMYGDRVFCWGGGGWESADEILKVLVSLSQAGGWAANSKCVMYGFR